MARDGPESSASRALLELLLGFGLIERKLAELHIAGGREGDAGEDDGDDARDVARNDVLTHGRNVRGAAHDGDGKQRDEHGRLDEHAHEELADTAEARVGVGGIHAGQREEEAGQRERVHDGDGVTKDGHGALEREHGQAHGEHERHREEQRRHDAQHEARVGTHGLGTRHELREVPVILKDGRTAAIVHLRANHTGEAGEEGRDQHDHEALRYRKNDVHNILSPL